MFIPETCSTQPETIRFNQQQTTGNVQITLLIKLVPKMKKTVGSIRRILRKIKADYSRKYNVQFCVVGFGGARIRKDPHIQTGGHQVFMDYTDATKAIQALKFDGNNTDRRYFSTY